MFVNVLIALTIVFFVFLAAFMALFILRLLFFRQMPFLKLLGICFVISLLVGGPVSKFMVDQKIAEENAKIDEIKKAGCVRMMGKKLAAVNEVYKVAFKAGTYRVTTGLSTIDYGFGEEQLAEVQMVAPEKSNELRPIRLEMLPGFKAVGCPR